MKSAERDLLLTPSRLALLYVSDSATLTQIKEFDSLECRIWECGRSLHASQDMGLFRHLSVHLNTHLAAMCFNMYVETILGFLCLILETFRHVDTQIIAFTRLTRCFPVARGAVWMNSNSSDVLQFDVICGWWKTLARDPDPVVHAVLSAFMTNLYDLVYRTAHAGLYKNVLLPLFVVRCACVHRCFAKLKWYVGRKFRNISSLMPSTMSSNHSFHCTPISEISRCKNTSPSL
jgi:hypothetical protein